MLYSLRTVLAGILLVAVVAPCVRADDASHRKAADELLAAMRVKESQQETIDQMLDVMSRQNPALQQHKDVFKKFLEECLDWNAMKDDYAKMYMEEFTEPEMKELAAFYKTPVGQKLAKKTAVLAGKSAKIGAARMQSNLPKLQKMIQERMGQPSL